MATSINKLFSFVNLLLLAANAAGVYWLFCPPSGGGEPSANESVFKFRVNSDAFQFNEERATPAQAEINKRLAAAKAKYLNEFKDDFSDFLKICETESAAYCPSIDIKTRVSQNTPKLFSARMDIVPWHQGACGNPEEVETFNFAISGEKIRELSLGDVVADKRKQINLLWRAFQKARAAQSDEILDGITEASFKENCLGKGGYLSKIKFTLRENGVEIIFPSGEMTGRALGAFSAVVSLD